MGLLDNKKILITGGSRGIGEALVKAMAKEGADIGFSYRSSAESAKRVVEKVLQSAGANVGDIRSELEKYLAKQPKITGDSSQKMMGRSLQKVLESARENKGLLSDSFVSTEALILALVKEEKEPTLAAVLK